MKSKLLLLFKLLVCLLVVITTFALYIFFFKKDFSSIMSLIYLNFIILLYIFKWPTTGLLAIERAATSAGIKKLKTLNLEHISTGKKVNTVEYIKYPIKDVADDHTLQSYFQAELWVNETKGIINDIEAAKIIAMFVLVVVFLVMTLSSPSFIKLLKETKPNNLTYKISQSNDQLIIIDDGLRMPISTFPMFATITYYFAICHFAFKRNKKV